MLTEKAEKLVYIYWNTRILHQLGRFISVKDLQGNIVTINNIETNNVHLDNRELVLENNEIFEDNFTNRLLNIFDD
ncbi:23962_t:CDS:1, partial [Dentiscutata erythropus]